MYRVNNCNLIDNCGVSSADVGNSKKEQSAPALDKLDLGYDPDLRDLRDQYWQLNWGDPAEVRASLSQLPREFELLLNAAQWRLDRCARLSEQTRLDYFANAALLLLGGHPSAAAVCRCGQGNHFCGLWKCCPHCRSYYVRQLEATFHCLSERLDSLFFCTISPTEGLCFQDEDFEEAVPVWDAAYFGLDRTVELGIARGVFLCEEFAPEAFWPIQKGRPHTHAFICADQFSPNNRLDLSNVVNGWAGEVQLSEKEMLEWRGDVVDKKRRWVRFSKKGLNCEIDVEVVPVKTAADLRHLLRYIIKPVRWPSVYDRWWGKLGISHNRDLANFFNTGVSSLIGLSEDFARGRNKVRRLGCFNGCRKDFIGVRKPQRNTSENRAAVESWIAECKAIQEERNRTNWPLEDDFVT